MKATATATVYRRRHGVLAVVMAVNFSIQLLWISYAPITSFAGRYYAVGEVAIGLLSLVFMAAFIPLSIPSSWLLDARGFRYGVGIAAVIATGAAVVRGLVGASYISALLATIVIACCQPVILNSWSMVAAKWFPRSGRASAVGLIVLANLLGTGAGMVLTPMLLTTMSISHIQIAYGVVMGLSAAAFIAVAGEHPPTPPELDDEPVTVQMLAGLRGAITSPGMWLLLAAIFVGMGVFNGISTWIEQIVAPYGMDAESAGLVGAAMLGGGLLGAVALSSLSDRSGRRVAILIAGAAGAAIALAWFALSSVALSFYLSGALMGFCLTGLLPVLMQYGAEIAAPAPEATSAGLLQLVGQAGGVLAFGMAAIRSWTGSYTASLVAFAVLLLLIAALFSRLPEPTRASGITT